MESIEKESLVINRFRYVESMLKDYYTTIFFTMPQLIFVYALSAFCVVYGVVNAIMGNGFYLILAAVILVAIMLTFVFVYYKRSTAKSIARFMQKQSDYEEDNVVYVTPDRVLVQECNGVRHSIAYGEFIRFQEAKTLYLLATSDKRFVFLPKDGFVKGDANALLTFLKSNCPRIARQLKHRDSLDSTEIG